MLMPTRRLCASLGANRAVTAILPPPLLEIESAHKHILSCPFNTGITPTTHPPTPARENSFLTGQAEDEPPFCVCLMGCERSERGCLHTNSSTGTTTHASRQRIPVPKLSDGSSHSWDVAQPRVGPGAATIRCVRGMAQTVPVPHPPSTAATIRPCVLIMLKPDGSENPFSPDLFSQRTGLELGRCGY